MMSTVNVEVLDAGIHLPPDVCCTLFKARSEPLVVRGQLNSWIDSRLWDPKEICRCLGERTTTFKLSPKRGTTAFCKHFRDKEVVFETECDYVVTTFNNFLEWLVYSKSSNSENECKPSPCKRVKMDQSQTSETVTDNVAASVVSETASSMPSVETNPLMDYPSEEYWVYADYKYMIELCKDFPNLLSAVDWGVVGFKERDGRESTLWIGSEGANTPCHYDTYGCNFVAQLHGRKKWTLFHPRDSDKLYPSHIPYEESSVFSRVNVADPDLVKYPLFSQAISHEVILEPGDLLYVPRHWWHYVESVGDDTTMSINTWVDLPEDAHDKVKEAIVRTIVSAFANEEEGEMSQWVNPNETLFSNDENIQLLSRVLKDYKKMNNESTSAKCTELTSTDFLRIVTSPTVVDAITKVLTKS